MKNNQIQLTINLNQQEVILNGIGNGIIEATVNALGNQIEVLSYEEKSTGHTTNSEAITIIECQANNNITKFGVGRHQDIATSSIIAVVNAHTRLQLATNL